MRQIARVKERHPLKDDGEIALLERRIDFILTTANNWKGPIQHFRLSVQCDSPDDIVLTCMPGLKRVGPTSYEFSRSDFHPQSDMKLLILQANKPE